MRIAWLAVLALACCPRGDTTPPAADADAEMDGATVVLVDGALERPGGLRPGRGDAHDWWRLDAPPGVLLALAIEVVSPSRELVLAVHAPDGRVLSRGNRVPGASGLTIVADDVPPAARVFVHVATADGRDARYVLRIRETARTAAPGGTPCDPEAYDAANPLCRGVCDFADPPDADPRCCGIWRRCLGPEGFCAANVVGVRFPIVLDLGRARGLYAEDRAAEPDHAAVGVLVRASGRARIELQRTGDADSTWALTAPRDDVHDPFVHHERAEIYPPPMCRAALGTPAPRLP